MKEKPVEPDLEALKKAFDAQPGHSRLRSLQTLHNESQLLLWKTIKEMRKFVSAMPDEVKRVFFLSLQFVELIYFLL
jgi:hypothetical protein